MEIENGRPLQAPATGITTTAIVTQPTGEPFPRRITAPAAAAAGRWIGRLAPVLTIVALLLAAAHLPRECFNAAGQPKTRHKTREYAERERHALLAAGRAGRALKTYLCKRCGFWHVGHTGRRRRRGGGHG